MVVILGNRGVRPCQTLTILLHQSAARLGTRARRSGLDLRCDLSTFGQLGPDCRSRGEYATWPCSILPSIASFGAAILWRSRPRISLRTVMRSTVQQCGRKRAGRPVKFELTGLAAAFARITASEVFSAEDHILPHCWKSRVVHHSKFDRRLAMGPRAPEA